MEGAGPCERTLTQNLLIRKLMPCGLVSWVARTFLRTLAGFSGGKNGAPEAAELPCPKVKFFLEKNWKNIFILEKVCQSLQAQTEINWFPVCMKVFHKNAF